MNIKYIMFLLLTLIAFNSNAHDSDEILMDLETRIELLEKNLATKTPDNSSIYTKIDHLEEVVKNLNNKTEELNRQVNHYSNSLRDLKNELNNKTSVENKPSIKSEPPIDMINEDTIQKLDKAAINIPDKAEDTEASNQIIKSTSQTKEAFENAFSLLKKSEYEQAEKAFSDFITTYPKDELSGNAYYWLGESFYLRKIYNKAALNYLYSIKYFPIGSKAELSTYKLSMSFSKLDRKQEACQSFTNFLEKFKKAPASLVKSSHEEVKRLDCENL